MNPAIDQPPTASRAAHKYPLRRGLVWAILAPVLAPLPVAAGAVLARAAASLTHPAFDPTIVIVLLPILAIYGFFALALSTSATLCFGLPLVLLLRKIGRLHGVYVCLAAMLVGAVVMAGFPALLNAGHHQTVRAALRGLALGAGFGCISGLALCFGSGIPFHGNAGR
jgi:hypothetical protein